MTARTAAPVPGLSLRMPPVNLEAERALLGALLSNNKAYDACTGLRAEHFADPVHVRIYDVVQRRIEAGRMVDAVALKSELEHDSALEEVGGVAYLAQLLAAFVGLPAVPEYARAIRDAWLRRELIGVGEAMIHRCYAPEGMTGPAIQEEAEEAMARLADGQEEEAAPITAAAAMQLAIEQAVAAAERPGGLVGITTGLRDLDAITGGLQRGLYYMLGARPSVGKTTLAQTIAANAAGAGARVLLVSMEMTPVGLGGQLVAGMTPIHRDLATRGKRPQRDELGRFRWEKLSEGDVGAMVRAQQAMASRPMEVVYLRNPTMGALRTLVRRKKRRGGLDLVLVDYLGLMRVPELARFDNRVLEVTRLSAATKALAADFDIPVVMLGQLNREVENRDGHRPMLADLRDSGAIEQDADVVMFLHREHYHLTRRPPARGERDDAEAWANKLSKHAARLRETEGRAEVIVAKQRMGRTGVVHLRFDDDTTWYRDLEDEAVAS